MVTPAAMVDGTTTPGITSSPMVSRLNPHIPILAVPVLLELAHTTLASELSRLLAQPITTRWALQLLTFKVLLMEDPFLSLLIRQAQSSCTTKMVSLPMLLPVVPIKTTPSSLLDMELILQPTCLTSL